MIDAVISFHMNPLTCGVSKFNHALAQRLGVPCLGATYEARECRRPLVSVKASEWDGWEVNTDHPRSWWKYIYDNFNSYELFFHDAPGVNGNSERVIKRAWRVFAADASIAVALRPIRPDVVTAFCPGTVNGNAERGAYRVLVFGMASKLNLPQFQTLKATLDQEHPGYTVSLSTAVHEGSPWDAGLNDGIDAMRAIFGDKLRVLGFLGDDALAKELQDCDAVAAYFTPALRANNTSAWAALAAGKKLYTNTDEYSPVLDVDAHSWERLEWLLRA